jgi:hypothetical protein
MMKKYMALFGALALGACSISGPQATIDAKAVVAGNAAGAAVAGIVNPGASVPATAIAAIGDGLACSVSAIFGGSC